MKCKRTMAHGGNGGSPFQDNLTQAVRMAGFVIRHGSYVDGLMGIYKDAKNNTLPGMWYGGTGGKQDAVAFADDEHLIKVSGRSGSNVDQLTFVTNKRTYGPYGEGGGTPWEITTTAKLVGFFGRSGSLIDQIGFFELIDARSYVPSTAHGGGGGVEFTTDLTEVDRMVGVAVRSGQYMDGIQAIFKTVYGQEVRSAWFGGNGGTPGEFRLADGELITRVEGRSGGYVDSLTFSTDKGKTYRYGQQGGGQFELSGEICGFLGRSGSLLDQIGFFLPAVEAAALKPITQLEAVNVAKKAQKQAALAAVAAGAQTPELVKK